MIKTTDPHKESKAKTEEKGRDNENLQDMCKNHWDSVTWNICGGLATEKRKNLQSILSVGYSILLLIFTRYDKKNLMGNWKWYCFIWRNNLFKFEPSIHQNYITSQKWVEISHCSGKIIKVLSFWHVTPPHLCTDNVIKNFKFLFSDSNSLAYKEACCKPVLYKNKPFSTNIKLFYVTIKLFMSTLCNFAM